VQEYKIAKGEVIITLKGTGRVKIQASSKKPITLYGVSTSKEEIPFRFGENITFNETLSTDFTAIKLQVHGQVPIGYSFHEADSCRADPLNDQDPPAIPELTANNLVAQVHRMLRDNAKANRRAVLEPDDDHAWSQRYTIDEDDYRFEEEIFQSQQNPDPSTGATSSETPSDAPTSPEDAPESAERQERPIAAE